jgi:nucleoside-diphosphate-sugar epimerase
MRVALTGASGFVGRHLASQLGAVPIPFRLESSTQIGTLASFDALIHAAWDFHAQDDRNVAGSTRLFERAAAEGIPRILFISSLSAFEGCRSRYGKSKLAVENELTRFGGCSVRLGFVIDETDHGLSGGLKKLARLPVIPLPNGGNQLLHSSPNLAPVSLHSPIPNRSLSGNSSKPLPANKTPIPFSSPSRGKRCGLRCAPPKLSAFISISAVIAFSA